MVKHIVQFKLKENISTELKNQTMNAFKEAIEALPEKIDFIRKVEVGLNINPNEKWDICLYSEFDSLEDVNKYAIHPAHLAAARLLAECKGERACVDYYV